MKTQIMWTMDKKLIFFLVVFFFVLTQAVQCLKCVQCSSLYEVECTDGYIEPKNCSKNESFCTKYEGTLGKVKFVIRGCSDEEETADCGLRTIQNGMTVNVCFETCRMDGCNSALTITKGSTDLIITYVMPLFVFWSMYKQLFLENT